MRNHSSRSFVINASAIFFVRNSRCTNIPSLVEYSGTDAIFFSKPYGLCLPEKAPCKSRLFFPCIQNGVLHPSSKGFPDSHFVSAESAPVKTGAPCFMRAGVQDCADAAPSMVDQTQERSAYAELISRRTRSEKRWLFCSILYRSPSNPFSSLAVDIRTSVFFNFVYHKEPAIGRCFCRKTETVTYGVCQRCGFQKVIRRV